MKLAVVTPSVLLATLLCVPTAMASPYDDHSPGVYVFGGGGMSNFNWDERDVRYSFGDGSLRRLEVDEQSSAARIGVGLAMGPHLALEMGYAHLGDIGASGYSDGSQVANKGYSAGRVDIDGRVDAVFIGLRLHTPMREPVGLYARLGLTSWELEGQLEDSRRRGDFLVEGSGPYAGAGMRLAISEYADIQLGYDYYLLDDDRSVELSADVVSLDMVLRF